MKLSKNGIVVGIKDILALINMRYSDKLKLVFTRSKKLTDLHRKNVR